jgi:autotransporter-associated beta strand protein
VIGGTKNDTFTAGGLPVWFEGGDGGDSLAGGVGWDRLEGNNGGDSISGGYGDDMLLGGWGSDTLAGGPGNDTYSFADLFGTDTIIEIAGEGSDTMDFALVTSALTVSLGSVTVTAPGASATHAGTAIEAVIGGSNDDTFVMTSPSVTFPGTLDGGGGANTLRYDNATPTLVAQVNAGQTPNVGLALKLGSVIAVPAYTPVELTVPALATVVDSTPRSGNDRIIKKGSGTLILTLANSHTAGTSVEAGQVVVKNVAALGSGAILVKAGARLTLDVGIEEIDVASLVVEPGATVEIGFGRIRVAGGLVAADLVALLAAGRNGGAWDGASGIVSAAVAGAITAGDRRAIGWYDHGDGSISVGFAAPGDTNLDGQTDVLDAASFIAGGKFNTGSTATWSTGDFTYDGVTDIRDVADFMTAGLYNAGSYLPAGLAPVAFSAAIAPLSPLDAAFAVMALDQQPTPRKKNIFATI